jgi:xylan 1,4-beta-xylosidase
MSVTASCRCVSTTVAAGSLFGSSLDATILSDEHAVEFDGGEIRGLGFTGAFVGLWVWDLNGHGHHPDFDDAAYTTHF